VEHKQLISLVIPCYNEQDALPVVYRTICGVAAGMRNQDFEFIFVDDGSTDGTLELLHEYRKNSRVRYLSFSRNFGKEAAVLAGMRYAKGDYLVVMDADMQDPPSFISQMYTFLRENTDYDCVAARRTTRRGEPLLRSFCAHCFYRFINKISKTEIADGARDFRCMTRKMVDAILSLREYNRFSKGIFGWVGFKTKWLEYENVERAAGKTKWSFLKLLLYSMDGIIAFSTVPLTVASVVGLICCFLAVVLAVVFTVKTLILGDPVAGFPTLICVILLVGGVQIFSTGILGQYLAKTYLEVKHRPVYLIRETEKSKNYSTPQKGDCPVCPDQRSDQSATEENRP
jgi:glycosyltransferase involved in cell wall biosynthesis